MHVASSKVHDFTHRHQPDRDPENALDKLRADQLLGEVPDRAPRLRHKKIAIAWESQRRAMADAG